MFDIIRLAIGFIFFISAVYIIRRFKALTRKSWIILVVLSFAISFVLSYLPFENVFVAFPSAESAYKYNHSIKADVVMELDGNNSTFVVEKKDSTSFSCSIVPKKNDGWKIGMRHHTKRIWQAYSSECSVIVFQYKNTDDYYVYIMPVKEIQTIRDNKDSKFEPIETDKNLPLPQLAHLCAHVTDFDDEYQIEVNGIKVDGKMER